MRQRSGNHRVFWSLDAVSRGRRGHCQLRMVRAVDRAAGETGDPRASKEAPRHRRNQEQNRPYRRPCVGRIPGIGHDSSILSAHAAVASLSSPGALPAFCAWPGDFRALQDSAYTQRLQPGSAEPLHRRGLGILAGRRGFSGRPLGIGAVRVAVAAASQPGASGQQATAGVFQESRRWPNANTAKCSAVFR